MEKIESQEVAVKEKGLDILEQLLKPEIQDSLTQLIEQLPKLVELTTNLTKTYDLIKVITTDEVLKNDTISAVNEILSPVVSNAKVVMQNMIEAKDRMEENEEIIGVFGLMKMLKDPQVQNLLRFIDAFLQVSAEKKNEK